MALGMQLSGMKGNLIIINNGTEFLSLTFYININLYGNIFGSSVKHFFSHLNPL